MGVKTDRPLLIVDVDEVLGLFMQGFGTFLEGRGLEFRVDKFALFQNIYEPGESEHLAIEDGRKHFEDFFRYGCGDMTPTPGGVQALQGLSEQAAIVILTNAPGPARLARARWLGRHGMDYPLILNTGPKGPLAAGLASQAGGPSVFIDDLISNLDSVAETAPDISRFQHVADPRLRALAPAKPDLHTRIDDWAELRAAIERVIG
ncbi:MAG: hypothetical protein KA085_02750 [Phenylobacterium sp.]|nr:hypothetical protein [Phenylobacterium sp.]MBP9230206.1 hypothetical protein [Phenylobacterium sp.]MBP9756926.1 hypothetical protein [Phenylobacterium sp.]